MIDKETTATLTRLVATYSPSGQEGEAVDWLLERMQALGFSHAMRDPAGNAVGVIGKGPRQVVLLGHIDTVPGEIPVRIENGSLYGRGAVDAKGPLAAFVDAAARVGEIPGWELIVIGAVDEERESAGARYLVDQFSPDFLVVGEPGGWDKIVLGYKGSISARITVRLPNSHSAGPEPGPADAVFQIWQTILEAAKQKNEGKKRLFDQVHPKILGMGAGGNGFEAWAALETNTRLPVGLSPADWLAQLDQLARESTGECKALGAPIPAYKASKNTALVRAFLRGIREQGGRPGFVVKSGTADLNIVAPAWECPALVYGPGDSSLDHTPEEHIVLEEYLRSVEILSHALKNLAG